MQILYVLNGIEGTVHLPQSDFVISKYILLENEAMLLKVLIRQFLVVFFLDWNEEVLHFVRESLRRCLFPSTKKYLNNLYLKMIDEVFRRH